MEKIVKLFATDTFTNEYHARICAISFLMKAETWETIRLENTFVRNCTIQVKAIEVIEDKSHTKGYFRGLRFVKYEVKPNIWGIELLTYQWGEGFKVIGTHLNLLHKPSFI